MCKAKTRKAPAETPEAEFNNSPTLPSNGPAEEVHWEKPNFICRFRDDSFTKKTACRLLRILGCGIFHCARLQSAHYTTPTRIRMSFTGYVCLYHRPDTTEGIFRNAQGGLNVFPTETSVSFKCTHVHFMNAF